jgi:N-acetylneuraminate lyase
MRLEGLVAAVHTPFDDRGDLNLAAVERQADHLQRNGVDALFVGGTTGECHSLTVDERLALARRWAEVVNGGNQRLVVHVGAHCLRDSQTLAADAQESGADMIAAMAPSYFKPKSVETLVAWCAEIAGAAPDLPFYFYDIPSMTGVSLPMPEFLDLAGKRIPNLAGLKFTNPDLAAFQRCLNLEDGRFDVLWGTDESLLSASAVGAKGAVGSTYNFATPIYRRMLDGFRRGDLETARREQFRSVQLVEVLNRYGFMGAAKSVMGMLGVPVGPPRLPNEALSQERQAELRAELEATGFFEWIER